jgi:multidrug efflux pump subunit AcrA (membrane-fusion protein)
MNLDAWSRITDRRSRGGFVSLCAVALIVSGCGHEEKTDYESAYKPPKVQIVHPEVRNIVRVVGQPSFIESFERTSIYPKLTAYIEKWVVDIGDKVKKGDVLATLFVPELVEDFGTKRATVKLDQERVEMTRKIVEVSDADVKTAQARLEEAQAILGKYDAEVERWNSEVERLARQVKLGVVDPQVLLESSKQLKSSTAERDAAKATIKMASADLLSKEAALAKARVDVSVAQADLGVAESEAKRLEAWVGYLTLKAPFDGIIFARNANTFDFVLPSTGDPTADPRAPHLSPSGSAAPIYIVDRTDIVRIFVDIPEQDANYVNIGTRASVLVRAYRDQPISGSVTRTSWALNVQSRTLRAEIDLPNPGSKLLPGMYAYAKVIIDRPGVRALPMSALTHSGDKTYCWIENNGLAEKKEIRTGVNNGDWVEVTNLNRSKNGSEEADIEDEEAWAPITGTERVILGDLSVLSEDGKVEIEPSGEPTKAKTQATSGGSRTDESSRTELASRP